MQKKKILADKGLSFEKVFYDTVHGAIMILIISLAVNAAIAFVLMFGLWLDVLWKIVFGNESRVCEAFSFPCPTNMLQFLIQSFIILCFFLIMSFYFGRALSFWLGGSHDDDE